MTQFNSRLRDAFLVKQRHLLAALEIVPAFTPHGTTIGDDSEANWARALREFLPARYSVSPGHVMDSLGESSEQIDVLIYDSHYSPLWARTAGADLFIPAESVYAAFEVKQQMDRQLTDYAGKKIASARALRRTSMPVTHLSGTSPGRQQFDIIGGMLTTRSGWADLQGKAAVDQLLRLKGDRRVDIGCALRSVSFDLSDSPGGLQPEYSQPDTALLFFLLRLFRRLQRLGTVTALDVNAYVNGLRLGGPLLPPNEPRDGSEQRIRGLPNGNRAS